MRILTKMTASQFVEFTAISKIFAVINHLYLDINHTKKQAENTLSSCSFLFLKTLFHFILQCISVPYKKAACVDKDKS